MADLEIAGGYLELKLTTAEKLEAVHGDLRAALSCVTGALNTAATAYWPVGRRRP